MVVQIMDEPPDGVRPKTTIVDPVGPVNESPTSTNPHQPPFPQLSDEAAPRQERSGAATPLSGEADEAGAAPCFDRSASPSATLMRNRGASYDRVDDHGVCKMHKFSLYETATRFYVVGGDILDRHFRVLKIDRTADVGQLAISEDDIIYTKLEMDQLLNAIDDGNRSSGGMRLKCTFWGILGFIRFTGAYHMLLITKRSQVAMIGGHYIFQIDDTELVTLTTANSSRFRSDRNPEETRFLAILNNLDLTRSFYYSYSYDITRTLQHNIAREREVLATAGPRPGRPMYHANAMFAWNHYLLEPAVESLKNTYDWCLPIVHGYVDQAILSVYGRTVYITIIARRSRFFAGARFLKRGANDLGYVANDVETEQIVSEMMTTSFHAPGPELYASPHYTSYVQHRGSIPLHWTQDNTGVSPKPPIELNLVDPFYVAAALHFDDLFERYGAPIYARERAPRESKLLLEYANAVTYLNQFLPEDKKIIYRAWDMSRASKSRDQDVIGTLEHIADEVVRTTGFFHNGDVETSQPRMQNGVARTNCIDCLDRTNAAQFVIGKRALGHQLHALGIIEDTSIDYDTDAVNLFTHMYHDHGDTIAVQYGGSHLVNTMETYRKINQWTSHSRDMVESFKRYYNNSFLDGQRQEAYNLFLGNYIFAQGQPMLWDLSTDYYLHHSDPRTWLKKQRRSYISWFTPAALRTRALPPLPRHAELIKHQPLAFFDDYWLEYYRPLSLSSFMKVFSYKMNSTLRYVPVKSTQDGRYDLSPFCVRTGTEHEAIDKGRGKKGVNFMETNEESSDDTSSQFSFSTSPKKGEKRGKHEKGERSGTTSKGISIQRWLQPQLSEKTMDRHHHHHHHQPHHHSHHPRHHRSPSGGILKEPRNDTPSYPHMETHFDVLTPATSTHAMPSATVDKSLAAQWTLDDFVTNSLNPSVTRAEAREYNRYVSHPLNLPLVISTDTPSNPSLDLVQYVTGVRPSFFPSSSSTVKEEDLADFADFLDVSENPLTVSEADAPKKRYKAYRQWLKGKSLFKQIRVDA
ncbi:MAG: phosphatidylinositol-3,5-bisphosphate 5-phosphatase [Thelocarpon superellum]|nr:MAG: phosphatidylinositol-3,5-bisphosphate 5-phosphatase [Thelocarpon superellum]